MRGKSIQTIIRLVLLAFFSLVALSIAVTFWAIHTQEQDALVINLAGRQRMLTQKITWLASSQPQNPELADSIALFESTLSALRDGGITQYGPPGSRLIVDLDTAPDADLRSALDEADALWVAFQRSVQPLNEPALQRDSSLILAHLDSIVLMYEQRASAKLARLQSIQIVFFLAALLLVGWSYLLVRRRIFLPLTELGAAARRITAGEMHQPVVVAPVNRALDELGELSLAFEDMRAKIAAAQDQLEQRVARRARELATAFEFSQEIVSQLDLNQLQRSVVERARSLTGAQATALCLLNGQQNELELISSNGGGNGHLNLLQPLQRDPAFRVVNGGETVVTQTECTQCAFLTAYNPGECAVAPLRAGNVTLGGLCVVRPAGKAFDEDETRALALLANSAAIAIANARLVDTGRRQAEQVAVQTERERLAAELHDNLAQTLGFLRLKAESIKKMLVSGEENPGIAEIEQMRAAIEGAYEQVRVALVGLSMPLSNAHQFHQQLNDVLQHSRQQNSTEIILQAEKLEISDVPELLQAQALHIVREALANTAKHARAQHIWVQLEGDGERIYISIEDDGNGFDPQAVIGSHHLGLRLMRARAERVGGTLTVESAPGEGTRVVAWLPLSLEKTSP